MRQAVIVKGNIHKGTKGITVLLDSETPFPELLNCIAEKFQELSDFLKQSHLAVSLEGRTLTPAQQQAILDTITENSQIGILYLLEEDEQKEQLYSQKLEAALQKQQKPEPAENMFYKGTLRSGQIVESESSIVIIGDVNPGGKVVSGGNIIVLGALKGVAYAGISGNRQAFVVAMEMKPMQIRIDNIVAKCSDAIVNQRRVKRKKRTNTDETPKIALLRDESIYIENLDKDTLSSLDFS